MAFQLPNQHNCTWGHCSQLTQQKRACKFLSIKSSAFHGFLMGNVQNSVACKLLQGVRPHMLSARVL